MKLFRFINYFRDFSTSHFGWLLVVANLLFFAYLFNEIVHLQELSVGFCDENGNLHFGSVQASNLFTLYVGINLPSIIIGQKLSEIIFWNFNDPCINYTYAKYPLIFVGKFAILILCQSIQWFSIGYFFEKLIKLAEKIRNSK